MSPVPNATVAIESNFKIKMYLYFCSINPQQQQQQPQHNVAYAAGRWFVNFRPFFMIDSGNCNYISCSLRIRYSFWVLLWSLIIAQDY